MEIPTLAAHAGATDQAGVELFAYEMAADLATNGTAGLKDIRASIDGLLSLGLPGSANDEVRRLRAAITSLQASFMALPNEVAGATMARKVKQA